MTWITKEIVLGKRQHKYTFDIEATVTQDYEDKGVYSVGAYDIQIMKGAKVIKDKHAAKIKTCFFKEYDTGDIDILLIEAM